MGLKVIVGWATPTQPITRTISNPDHIRCINEIISIEAWQPWDVERQRYMGKHLEWKVVDDERYSD